MWNYELNSQFEIHYPLLRFRLRFAQNLLPRRALAENRALVAFGFAGRAEGAAMVDQQVRKQRPVGRRVVPYLVEAVILFGRHVRNCCQIPLEVLALRAGNLAP